MSSPIEQLSRRLEAHDHPLVHQQTQTAAFGGVVLETLRFRASDGQAVRGLLLRPGQNGGALPAILYIHAHGDRYAIGADELTDGRPALQAPLGPALAEAGYAVLCIDLPCFGTRQHPGESSAAKAALWNGRSLAGRMIGELTSALDWLISRPDIDAQRIGCFGISMGATLGYWLAAIDPRIRAIAHLCCLADFAALIEMGHHDLHGIYLTVPGLLPLAGNGEIAGLIAPRAQLVGLGDLDALTPPRAVAPALETLMTAYGKTGGELVIIREPEFGHAESPRMRAQLLPFFDRNLR